MTVDATGPVPDTVLVHCYQWSHSEDGANDVDDSGRGGRTGVGVAGRPDGIERELGAIGWDTCHVVGGSLGGQLAS
ncbi:hypothetical protein [Gordonia sp. NPDC003950]